MKINKYSLMLFSISIILSVLFIIVLISDYSNYYLYGSSPFYLYIIERFVEFIFPAGICFAVAMRRKDK